MCESLFGPRTAVVFTMHRVAVARPVAPAAPATAPPPPLALATRFVAFAMILLRMSGLRLGLLVVGRHVVIRRRLMIGRRLLTGLRRKFVARFSDRDVLARPIVAVIATVAAAPPPPAPPRPARAAVVILLRRGNRSHRLGLVFGLPVFHRAEIFEVVLFFERCGDGFGPLGERLGGLMVSSALIVIVIANRSSRLRRCARF
jgi:hypothetical protein